MNDELIRRITELERDVERLRSLDSFSGATAGLATAVSQYLALPGLVGFWPGSAMGSSSSSTTELTDMSGHGLHLTRNGTPTLDTDGLIAWQEYDGSSDYYSHADATAFDITGGLTIVTWVYLDAISTWYSLVAKDDGATNRSYLLQHQNTNVFRFLVTNNGSSAFSVDTSTTIEVGKWHFVAGRFSPSAELKIWLGATGLQTDVNTISIPGSLYNGTASFAIGAYSGGGNKTNGRIAFTALCSTAVPDATITALYENTRGLFGV